MGGVVVVATEVDVGICVTVEVGDGGTFAAGAGLLRATKNQIAATASITAIPDNQNTLGLGIP